MSDIPYRRTYGRLLVAATVLFPLLPEEGNAAVRSVRALFGTLGMGVALLWAPVLIYAALRTKCAADCAVGIVGMMTLLYRC